MDAASIDGALPFRSISHPLVRGRHVSWMSPPGWRRVSIPAIAAATAFIVTATSVAAPAGATAPGVPPLGPLVPGADAAIGRRVVAATLVAELVASLVVDVVVAVDHDDAGKDNTAHIDG